MKKIVLVMLALLPLFAVNAQNDAKAEQIVKGILHKLKTNTYQGDFTMTFYSGETESTSSDKGALLMNGLKCKLSLGKNFILYDGVNHWAYSKDMNEVTLLEPSQNELKDINPLAMIESYISSYRILFSDEENCISFIPNNVKTGILFKIKLFYDGNKFPVKLIIFNRNGDKTTFTWNKIKTIPNDDSLFVFDKSQFPGVEINDLR